MKYSLQCTATDMALKNLPKSHMTLMYLGEQEESAIANLNIDNLFYRFNSANGVSWPMAVKPNSSIKTYGPEDKPVLAIELAKTNNLMLLRAIVEDTVDSIEMVPDTEFTKFRPHVTVPHKNIIIPSFVTLHFPHFISWES